eukprot:COSAG01_NODE_20890_length_929_cov_2.534940_2_plen_88_part_00
MAWSHTRGAKPWWYVMIQQLDSEDEDDSDYPSDGSDTESSPDDDPDASDDDNKSVDIVYTDNESESDWSEHTSDDEFIDDAEVGRPG